MFHPIGLVRLEIDLCQIQIRGSGAKEVALSPFKDKIQLNNMCIDCLNLSLFSQNSNMTFKGIQADVMRVKREWLRTSFVETQEIGAWHDEDNRSYFQSVSALGLFSSLGSGERYNLSE